MSKPNLKTNYLFQTIYQVLILIVPLITAPYLSRVLGPSAIGTQTLTYNIANYFVLFSMLGLAKYGLRCISESKDNQDECCNVFTELFFIHLLFSIIGIILYSAYVLIFVRDSTNIYWISIIYVVGTVFDINWVYFGLEKFKITVIRNLFVKLVSTVCIFVFVKTVDDLWLYVLILALSQFISYAFLWPTLFKEIRFTRFNLKTAFQKHIKNLLILFIPVIAISIYKSMDKIMIGFISGEEQLGYYESADRIVTITLAIISSIGTIILPRLSNVGKTGDAEEYNRIVGASNFFNCFLTCGCAFGLMGIATTFIPIFYGDNFKPAVSILLILSSTVLFASLSDFVRMSYLIPQKKDKIFVFCILIGALVNLVLNIPLIIFFGADGAAISTAITEMVVCILQYIFTRHYFKAKETFSNLLPFVAIGLITFLLTHFSALFLPGEILKLILQFAIGFFAYLILSSLFIVIFKRKEIATIIHKSKQQNI